MLSYRHAFHAGNFADVLKHIVLVEILQHLVKKDSPFVYIDTHAGAGLYKLQVDTATARGQSVRSAEHPDGIGRLRAAEWPDLSGYLNAVRKVNNGESLNHYPGSPALARQFLRDRDRAWLFELHPTDHGLLARYCAGDRRLRVMQEDGFRGLSALLPPQCRRGLVLVDPPYEIKSDYSRGFDTLAACYRKFATGIYALWYPVVERRRIEQLEKKFIASGISNIQRFELGITADAPGYGMTAAGMIVINPPWTLMSRLSGLLPRLVVTLGQGPGAFCRADILVPERP